MMMKKFKILPLVVVLSIAASGCATIIGDATQTIPITSNPSQASIVIVDETGLEVFEGTTPASVTLNKSDGSYFGGKQYMVTIGKDGYGDQTIPIQAKVNGWYIGR